MSKVNVDPDKLGQDRYVMPVVDVRSQKNNKTYFSNIEEIAKSLDRTSEELLKFLGYHLNTQTNSNNFSFNGVYSKEKMQESIYDYIRAYVLCYVCNNPETKLVLSKSKKIKITCAACGGCQDVSSNVKFDKWLITKLGSESGKDNKQ